MTNKYCIIRLEKVKSWTELQARARHNNRTSKIRETDTYDVSKSASNEILRPENVKNPGAIKAAYDGYMSRLSRKPRPDAVRAVELVVTFSPEVKDILSPDDQRKYFQDSIQHLKNKFGEDNFFGGWIHHDEETPHAHLFYIPIDANNVLNFKGFMHGKNAFSQFQTDFYNEVGKKYGLDRGEIKEEKKQHVDVRTYKKELLFKEVDKELKLYELDAAKAELQEREQELKAREAQLDQKEKELLEAFAAVKTKDAALDAEFEVLTAKSLELDGLRKFFEKQHLNQTKQLNAQYKAKLTEFETPLKTINEAIELHDDFQTHLNLRLNGDLRAVNNFYEANKDWTVGLDPTKEQNYSSKDIEFGR